MAEQTERQKSVAEAHTLYDIAIVKSYTYCEEYNSNSGQTQMKDGYRYLKQGYIDGFLAGFTYKLTGEE
jgi:hypothetical protein